MRPGNRYARERGFGRTLGQLIDSKMALVAIYRRCKHQRVLYPPNYIDRFGQDCPAIDLREHLRCSSCRGRMANLHEPVKRLPELPPLRHEELPPPLRFMISVGARSRR
jgi:hypothetical protein